MKVGKNIGNAPGPTPGNAHAVKQHQAIAQGYVVEASPRRVKTFQREETTGDTSAPGLTSKAKPNRM